MAPSTTSESVGVHPKRTIAKSRKLLYGLFTVCLFFGITELLVRLTWTPPPAHGREVGGRQFINWLSRLSLDDREEIPLYQPHPTRIWTLSSSKTFHGINYHHAPDGEAQPLQITVNPEGYRGPVASEPTASNQRRILCLGDSNFFGYPLDDRHAFPAVLEKVLNDSHTDMQWQTINAGIPGYSSHQGRLWFDEQFSSQSFDWLLISYLNNDAWLQPQRDANIITSAAPPLLLDLSNGFVARSRFAQFLEWTLKKGSRDRIGIERVSLPEFRENYKYLISKVRQKGTRVIILDYCMYENYVRYSTALEEIAATEPDVEYFHIAKHAVSAIENGWYRNASREYQDAIRRRWGDRLLSENPMLWMYAEFNPEHLNEIGTAWLAEITAEMIRNSKRDKASDR